MTRKTSLLLFSILAFLFGGFPFAGLSTAKAAAQATFVRTDSSTQGNWTGVYGNDGYVIPGMTTNKTPGYVTVTPQNQATWAWTSNGTETRDLQVAGNTIIRQASCWYTSNTNSFSLDVNVTDGNSHQFALYLLDWDSKGRSETIQAVDGSTGAVLDTRSASGFANGMYLVWDISGHVTFNVTLTGGLNAVVSGAFFDVATANSSAGIAHFVSTDTTTQGNWQGVYGVDGYSVVGDKQSLPAYAVLTPQNQLSWTWAATSTETRVLQTADGTGRVAATWYNNPAFSIDVNITDGNSHQVALYALDWDNRGRVETVQVVDAHTNAVLDSRSLSSFTNGVYAAWTVSGHVKFNVTCTGGVNAVISGVFFGGAGSAPAPKTTTNTSTVSTSTISNGTTSAASTGTTGGTGSGTTAQPSGMVLHWTFDSSNISGTTVVDTSNHGGNGTMYGNPAPSAGRINQALTFNGVNSYVSMPAASDGSAAFNNSMTVAAWIKTTTSGRVESIVSKFSAAGSAAGYIFETDGAGHVGLRVGAQDLYAYPGTVVDTTKVNDGQWHHVAMVITLMQGTQFFVDGNLSSTASMSVWGGGDGWSDLEVGTSSYTPYAQYFSGSIDDVQIYNRALSAAEISAVFSGDGSAPAQTTSTTQTSTTASITTPPVTTTQTQAQTQTTTGQGLLSVTPASFNFGSIKVGSISAQTFTVSNSGTASVMISSAAVSGAGFNATGVSAGTVLAPGQSITLNATFAPASATAVTGGVTLTSNASNTTQSLTLSGTGVQPPVAHSVALSWAGSSSSNVVGYQIYRGTVAAGPYAQMTTNPVAGTSYTDSTAQSGSTYFYVVTSVDSSNNQSTFSNIVSAIVP